MMKLDIPRPHLVGDTGQFIHSSPCGRYQIWRAVIPTFPAEAIVNATNRQMILNTSIVPGGEFQIIRAAGNGLKEYLYETYGSGSGLPVGEAITTPSFEMANCWFLIHVNGPNYRMRTRRTLPLLKQQLADCYRRCLEEADKHGIKSIAFPCLSTGATLGWPRAVAARIGIDTMRRWFNHPIFGQRRRERIPGPIFFLADPVGPYSHQEEAWLAAFK
ncbi:macro domain-like protein [Mollisia scopiformis]|uniref:Macro domain-like protein n=1 Tax=Mollisia scopiformis TaxID=149040 RepID=A0A194WVN0_MOLSC|nr:macro domain-like protein [Mollisia scopiformis]KUJ12020.1 macro domain-like protein [Mollisia scopiformis]